MASVSVLDNIVIDEVVMATSVGNSVHDVFAATATGLRNERRISIDKPGFGEAERVEITCFPIADPDISEISIRLHAILTSAIEQLVKSVGTDAPENTRFHLLLPPEESARARFINREKVAKIINVLQPAFSRCEISCSYADGNATHALVDCCRAIANGECQTVIFGGVDTLINAGTVSEFFRQGRFPNDPAAGRASLGEAAAFVVLRRADETGSEPSKDKIYIGGIANDDEPSSGKAGITKLSGLATSINGLFTGLGLTPADMQRVVHNLQGEKAYSLEWLQVENAVWPNQLPEELRQAMQEGLMEAPDNPDEHKLDTLGLTPVLGDTGAAALPLSLGLGVGKLDYFQRYSGFQLPFANDVLVVDAGDIPTRGAIYLKRGGGRTSDSPSRTD